MRRLLEDMLWLARFDAAATPRDAEPVDLATLAPPGRGPVRGRRRDAAARARRHTSPRAGGHRGAPELVDRLLGVLLDNACKYAPGGRRVDVTVVADAAGRAR